VATCGLAAKAFDAKSNRQQQYFKQIKIKKCKQKE
jgi:hypothetical protein